MSGWLKRIGLVVAQRFLPPGALVATTAVLNPDVMNDSGRGKAWWDANMRTQLAEALARSLVENAELVKPKETLDEAGVAYRASLIVLTPEQAADLCAKAYMAGYSGMYGGQG